MPAFLCQQIRERNVGRRFVLISVSCRCFIAQRIFFSEIKAVMSESLISAEEPVSATDAVAFGVCMPFQIGYIQVVSFLLVQFSVDRFFMRHGCHVSFSVMDWNVLTLFVRGYSWKAVRTGPRRSAGPHALSMFNLTLKCRSLSWICFCCFDVVRILWPAGSTSLSVPIVGWT